MSWLRTRIARLRGSKHQPAPSRALREAERVQARTEDRLEAVKRETRAILSVADNLKRLGEQNDFAARLRSALGGPGE